MSKSKIELAYGGGFIDILLDIASGRLELYLGGGFGRYGEEADDNHFHSRFGGKQYYQSRSGASGAGWVPARPTLKRVNAYRVDVRDPWIELGGREGYPPALVGGWEIWVPFDYRARTIARDWPVVARNSEGHLTFLRDGGEVVALLTGTKLETRHAEYRFTYIKRPGEAPVEDDCLAIVSESTQCRWANARRLIEHLHFGELAFEYPEGWSEEGDANFWRRLGLRRLPDAFYKVIRGIARSRHTVEEVVTVDGLQKIVPANVLVVAPHMYVQEQCDGRHVGVGRFAYDGVLYDFEVYLESSRAFRILTGDSEEILSLERELEAGAAEKRAQDLELVRQQERAAREELARDEKLRAGIEKYADVELTVQDSLDAGNCRPGTDDFVRRFFPGRTTASVAEVAKFISHPRVRQVLEHKFLKLETEKPNS